VKSTISVPGSGATEARANSALAMSRRGFGASVLATAAAASLPAWADTMPFRRGVNLWHLMEITPRHRDGMPIWPAFASPQNEMPDWQLRQLARVGFDFVRLPILPEVIMLAPVAERDHLHSEIRACVRRCLGAGLAVVLDIHPNFNLVGYEPKDLVANEDGALFHAYGDAVAELVRVLSDFSSGRVALELMNVPWLRTGLEESRWQRMTETLHAAARSVSSDLRLVLCGGQSSPEELTWLDPRPFAGSDVFFTFHYYKPMIFTHQGAGRDLEHLDSLPWPEWRGSEAEAKRRAFRGIRETSLSAAQRGQAQAAAGQKLDYYFSDPFGPDNIESDFASVAAWAYRNGIDRSRVIVGEFGVNRAIRGRPGALRSDRGRWLKFVRLTAERDGFGWAFWAYSGQDGMTLANEFPARTLDTETLRALGLDGRERIKRLP
jgi:hypothetical protein